MHIYVLPIAQVTDENSLICSILQKRKKMSIILQNLRGSANREVLDSNPTGFGLVKLGWAGKQQKKKNKKKIKKNKPN